MAKFKTRARALEMLGSQQIAGIPTAISELFKNAHDAYADRAEIDYYRSDNLFVLRDDGFGMTEEDFVQRWLTLGTASKVGATTRKRHEFSMPGKPSRPILGEKGIGRLAIALIGSQVLILTRAIRDNKAQDLVAAFIHWGIFECPDLDLDDIEIPVQTFTDGKLPSKNDVQELVNRFHQNLERLEDRIDTEQVLHIEKDLKGFVLDPQEIDSYVPTMSLAGTKHGTHFIIRPASAMLQQEALELDIEKPDDKAPNLVRMLGGFTNTMVSEHAKPVITVAFRDHKTDDYPADNIIDPNKFFTPEEFKKADHRVQGTFDTYGQFRGTVEIYGKKFCDHIISWKDGKGLPTACGPFDIDFATVQGAQRESRLSAEDWVELTGKMDKFGGLYIYRDGIRVLPYGNTDYDWLNIEKRRTYGAAYYYFSFRRMFGVVSINRENNGKLKEKAGREGFQENEAYRQFRSILENFLVQLAADFFREKSPEKHFFNVKDELQRKATLREKREKEAHGIRQKLAQNLELFFRQYDAGHYSTAVNTLFDEIRQQLQSVLHMRNTYEASKQFLRVEKKGRQKLAALEKSCRIGYPRGFALDTNLQRDWNNYQETFASLQEKVFKPAFQQLIQLIGDFSKQNKIILDRRLRLEQTVDEYVKETDQATTSENKATGKGAESVHQKVKDELKESGKRVDATLREVKDELAHIDVSTLTDSEIVDIQIRLQKRLQEVERQECDLLGSIRRQLEAIDVSGEGGLIDQLEAVEERTLALEEQADNDLQLVQLGMAIEIINHEFNASIRSVRQCLKRLKSWADINPDLQNLYQNIRTSFDHLDGYLSMFTPLHRRLQRKAIVFKGAEIHTFLEDLFRERLKRHNTQIEATPAFQKIKITGYPSSFYPVFVNLVDNAIFWLKDQVKRTITLDALDGGELVIKDTGPGIPSRDKDFIFELGFSRKPGGRGMGLHISREVLLKIGYTLELRESKTGAEFHILPQRDTE